MPLVKDTLKAKIELAFKTAKANESDANSAMSDLAADLADAIDAYIKSGQVVGTCPAGAVSGNIV
jgi:hypothetical protein